MNNSLNNPVCSYAVARPALPSPSSRIPPLPNLRQQGTPPPCQIASHRVLIVTFISHSQSLLHRVRHSQGKGTMVRLKFDRPYRLILIQDDQSKSWLVRARCRYAARDPSTVTSSHSFSGITHPISPSFTATINELIQSADPPLFLGTGL